MPRPTPSRRLSALAEFQRATVTGRSKHGCRLAATLLGADRFLTPWL